MTPTDVINWIEKNGQDRPTIAQAAEAATSINESLDAINQALEARNLNYRAVLQSLTHDNEISWTFGITINQFIR